MMREMNTCHMVKRLKELLSCDNQTLIDQSTSCDVDPLSITTCCNEQSASHVTPMIIDEQKTATPVDDGIKKVKVSIHNVFTLVCIPNLSIELCTQGVE